MKKYTIKRQYIDEETITEITKKEAIEKLEGGGFYKRDTVDEIINGGGGILRNLSAIYTIETL